MTQDPAKQGVLGLVSRVVVHPYSVSDLPLLGVGLAFDRALLPLVWPARLRRDQIQELRLCAADAQRLEAEPATMRAMPQARTLSVDSGSLPDVLDVTLDLVPPEILGVASEQSFDNEAARAAVQQWWRNRIPEVPVRHKRTSGPLGRVNAEVLVYVFGFVAPVAFAWGLILTAANDSTAGSRLFAALGTVALATAVCVLLILSYVTIRADSGSREHLGDQNSLHAHRLRRAAHIDSALVQLKRVPR